RFPAASMLQGSYFRQFCTFFILGFSFILYILLHFMYLLLKNMALIPVSSDSVMHSLFHQMTVTGCCVIQWSASLVNMLFDAGWP
ncbi:TPA: hypothetical protein ACS9OK_004362, partial [Salmonella enterica subsp. enterica serovar Virchow]